MAWSKKQHRTVWLVLVTVSLFGLSAIAQGHEGSLTQGLSLLLAEDFEMVPEHGLPDDWHPLNYTGSPDSPYVIDTPDDVDPSPNKALYLSRSSETANTTGLAALDFRPADERLVLSFKMWNSTHLRNLRITMGGTQGSDRGVHDWLTSTAIFIAMSNGTVRVLTDAKSNQWLDAAFYDAERWVQITLAIDITRQLMDVYIDDSPLPMNPEKLPFHVPSPNLNKLAFGYQQASASQNNTRPVYIDDLRIWAK